ncbi:hypothetical protein FB45DRAFT_928884 [Roridomyces roridus]|uniref:F-box domain-containing protein n=1 Tax=Roridomyces roridus TaxID=1738132 RepID=A0AAD7BHV9_9AGAR|nr:hypothetical protein FB45DRAFT_928884 [Roridomyces roridus]
MALLDLPADIILSVLSHCSVSDVISTAMTCRHLHALGFEKSVWLILLTDLKRRGFLDETHTAVLQDLTTQELVNLVKRVVLGPESWWPDEHGVVKPRVAREIVLHPTNVSERNQLVDGGRYLLTHGAATIECWDVVTDTLFWRLPEPPSEDDSQIGDFAAEFRDEDQSLVIMIHRECTVAPEHSIEVIQVDFRTEIHASLLQVRLQKEVYYEIWGLVICGDLCVFSGYGRYTYVIFDWRNQCWLELSNVPLDDYAHGCPFTLELADDNAFLIVGDDTANELRIVHNAALRARLRPISTLSPPPFVLVSDIHPLLTHAFPSTVIQVRFENDFLRPVHELSVCKSPLAMDTYRVWVYITKSYYLPPVSPQESYGKEQRYSPSLLCGFTFSRHGDILRWRETSPPCVAPANLVTHLRRIAFSGHRCVRGEDTALEEHIVPPTACLPGLPNNLPIEYWCPILTTYSGALSFVSKSDSEIMVQYFQ